MKRKIIGLICALAILASPLGAVQARINNPESNFEQMEEMMDQMMNGQLDANSQMALSEILTSKTEGSFVKSGKFNRSHFTDKSYDKSSAFYWSAMIVKTLSALLILLLLFLLNAVLYKKLTLMNKKKK